MNGNTSSKGYIRRRSFSRLVVHEKSLPPDLVEWLWMEPQSLVAAGEPMRCKGVRQTVRLLWGSQSFVLKHYVEPSRRHAAKQLFMRSRARYTWNVMHRMADAGIRTPRPLACVENRLGPLRRQSFLIYPYIEGRILRSVLDPDANEPWHSLEKLRQQLVELWQRLAELHASLADSNTGNFIVDPMGHLWVIDLDKARFYRRPRAAAQQRLRAWNQLERCAKGAFERGDGRHGSLPIGQASPAAPSQEKAA